MRDMKVFGVECDLVVMTQSEISQGTMASFSPFD